MRDLTTTEAQIIKKLLSFDGEFMQGFLQQVDQCHVETLDEYGSIRLVPAGEEDESINGDLANGRLTDLDSLSERGPFINIILFVKRGKICELQIYKDDGSNILSTVEPGRMSIYPGALYYRLARK